MIFSYGLLHMDIPMLANQQILTSALYSHRMQDLPGAIDHREGQQERVKEPCAVSEMMMMMMVMNPFTGR